MNSRSETTSNPDQDPPDAELVTRSQAGDLQAFDELVTRYRGKVYAMILNLIQNEADAWDLAQDAFVKAWKALPRFENRSSFFTWLYRISHNVAYDWMRRKKVRGGEGLEFDDTRAESMEPGSPTAPAPISQPDENAESSELQQTLEAAIARLSPDHRAVIVMKEVEGLKYQEIADVVGCSLGTVMSRLFYARRKLQHMLKDLNPNQSKS